MMLRLQLNQRRLDRFERVPIRYASLLASAVIFGFGGLKGQVPACQMSSRSPLVNAPSGMEFSGVGAAAVFSTGAVVVANRDPLALQFYDRDGQFVRSVGRLGEGPGEFKLAGSLIRLSGDTIALFDPVLQRAVLFSSDGTFGRTVSFRAPRNAAVGFAPIGLIGRGAAGWIVTSVVRARTTLGFSRDTFSMSVFAEADSTVRLIARVPGLERYGFDNGRGVAVLGTPLFSAGGFVAPAGADRVAYVDGNESIIRLYSIGRDAITLRAIRSPYKVAPLSKAIGEAAIREKLAPLNPEQLNRARPLQVTMLKYVQRIPSIGGMHGDGEGVWVRAYSRPGEPGQPWVRLRLDGTVQCNTLLPNDWRILGTGFGRIVAARTDDEGIESVVVQTIRNQN